VTTILRAEAASADSKFVTVQGRRLCYAEFGARDGFPVLALHGTPGSRLKFSIAHAEAKRLKLRIISLDRWGYGESTPHPNPSLVGFAEDIEQLLDRLSIRRFGLMGLSGGAPYAVAAAAAAKDRVSKLALISPLGPVDGLPSSELRLFHRICFRALPHIPGAATGVFRLYRHLLLMAPRSAIRLASLASLRQDKELIRSPEIIAHLSAAFREGLRNHAAGGQIDLHVFCRPWGVALQEIRADTRIWFGSEDINVPRAAVLRLALAIPRAELIQLQGCGHYWITIGANAVLRWMYVSERM
jgi:pimeloyl-ACP methyl ester carboxylesterase